MSVAFDKVTISANFTNDHSFDVTPVGTPRAVLILIVQDIAVDKVVGITYGGVAMTEVSESPVLGTTGEAGGLFGYFLGSGIPTGTQSVAIDAVDGSGTKRAYVFHLTAAADTEVEDTKTLDQIVANPSVTLVTGSGVETWIGAALHSGQDAVADITKGSDYTSVQELDFGTHVTDIVRRTSIATGGNVTVDWTAASEDAQILAVAVREVVAVIPKKPKRYTRSQAVNRASRW